MDDKLFCAVMCCCQKTPGTGTSGQNLYQSCVDSVFSSADEALGYKSRYKSEISYVMDPPLSAGEPMPLMSQTSGIPTKPTDYWQGRAREQLGDGWIQGAGMVRRPDVTVVKDPCLPPVQQYRTGRGDEVCRRPKRPRAECRVPNHRREQKQVLGYAVRWSPQGKNEQKCDCDDEGVKRLAPVQSQQEQEEAERRAQRLRTAGKVVAGGGALAALAAAAAAAVEAAGPWLVGLLAL